MAGHSSVQNKYQTRVAEPTHATRMPPNARLVPSWWLLHLSWMQKTVRQKPFISSSRFYLVWFPTTDFSAPKNKRVDDDATKGFKFVAIAETDFYTLSAPGTNSLNAG
jgi:hypothetical protein